MTAEGPRADCHPGRPRKTADGLCQKCYQERRRAEGPRADCHPSRPRETADGLCSTCEHRRRKYGLESMETDMMLAMQGGRCAIADCDHAPTDVDHCHATNEIRGLLCKRHNLMVGYARDNPSDLRATANYVELHAARIAALVA
jgi:hypothetical protein